MIITIILFGAALCATLMDAFGSPGPRHVWAPVMIASWILLAAYGISHDVNALHSDVRTALDRQMAMQRHINQLEELISEYGDRRQIAGHLAKIRRIRGDSDLHPVSDR